MKPTIKKRVKYRLWSLLSTNILLTKALNGLQFRESQGSESSLDRYQIPCYYLESYNLLEYL